jgi:hypothetical protein
MDEERKAILVAGIHLGDITLALAALAADLPPYARGLDIGRLVSDEADLAGIRADVDKWLAEVTQPDSLAPSVLRLILGRAIEKGKFLSAIRCLEILDEKDKYVAKYVSDGKKLSDKADWEGAAGAFVTASNLDIEEGIPLFQYLGAGLHDQCDTSPEKCVTRFGCDEAVLRGLKYLLSSERVFGEVAELPAEARKALLPRIALERDPNAVRFYSAYKAAHEDLNEIGATLISQLETDVRRVRDVISAFSSSLGNVTAAADTKDAIDRLKRTVVGTNKDFEDADDLVRAWQFRRIGDRMTRVIEARSEIEEIGGRAVAGESRSASVAPVLSLIDDLQERAVTEQIITIEQRLISTQTVMLGRQVASQEHWQFLREIAFKYPVSPLMVCLRRINDQWLVVPRWDSEIVGVLRGHFEKQPVPPAEPTSSQDR